MCLNTRSTFKLSIKVSNSVTIECPLAPASGVQGNFNFTIVEEEIDMNVCEDLSRKIEKVSRSS